MTMSPVPRNSALSEVKAAARNSLSRREAEALEAAQAKMAKTRAEELNRAELEAAKEEVAQAGTA